MSEVNANTSANNIALQQSTNAGDLEGTTPVGQQNQNLSLMDQSSMLHGTGSDWKIQNPAIDRQQIANQINAQLPRTTGTVTNGIPNGNGQFPGTFNNGQGVTGTTTRGVGEPPRVNSVTGTITPADGVTATVGASAPTPAARGGSVNAGVSATGSLGNGVTGTIGANVSQPVNGQPTTTISGSLQSGGTTVRGSSATGPTGTTNQVGITQQIGNSGTIGANASFAPNGTTTLTGTGSYQITPGLNGTASISTSPTETVGRLGVGFNF
jgi:hypothetical protein